MPSDRFVSKGSMGIGPDGKPFPVHATAASEYGAGALRGFVIGLCMRPDGTLGDGTPPLLDRVATIIAGLMTRGMYAPADVTARYASAEAPLAALPLALFFAGQPDDMRAALLAQGRLAEFGWRDRLAAVAVSAGVSAGAFDLASAHDMAVAAVVALDETASAAEPGDVATAGVPEAHASVRDDLRRAVAATRLADVHQALGEGAPDALSRALRQAFWHLVSGSDFAHGVPEVAARGEPIAAALTGVLLGAAHGSEAIPEPWRDAVASRAAPLLLMIAPE